MAFSSIFNSRIALFVTIAIIIGFLFAVDQASILTQSAEQRAAAYIASNRVFGEQKDCEVKTDHLCDYRDCSASDTTCGKGLLSGWVPGTTLIPPEYRELQTVTLAIDSDTGRESYELDVPAKRVSHQYGSNAHAPVTEQHTVPVQEINRLADKLVLYDLIARMNADVPPSTVHENSITIVSLQHASTVPSFDRSWNISSTVRCAESLCPLEFNVIKKALQEL